MIGLIVAYTKNRVIGNKGQIPWRIKGEQRRFRELTTGHTVIMGRKSYEEIGHPLPNRMNIIVSNTKTYEGENLKTARSLSEALEMAGNDDVYISGGAGIYREGLPLADVLYITEIDAVIEGDTYFPEFDTEEYIRTVDEEVDGDIPYKYVTFRKK